MINTVSNFLRNCFAASNDNSAATPTHKAVTLNEHASAYVFREAGHKAPVTAHDVKIKDEDSVKPEGIGCPAEHHFVTEHNPDAELEAARRDFEASGKPVLAVVFCNMGRFRASEATIANVLNKPPKSKGFPMTPSGM